MSDYWLKLIVRRIVILYVIEYKRQNKILAEASKRSIEMVTSAIGENETLVVYLLGEKHIGSLEKLAESSNGKAVVMPADIPGRYQRHDEK